MPGFVSPGPSNHLYYTANEVCTGDTIKIKEAQMSFPSGHSCAAFAGFGFLGLWLNAKCNVFGKREQLREKETAIGGNDYGRQAEGRVQHWKLIMLATPWCIAVLLAGSKVRDEWHHPIDVIFGALVGTAFAHVAFRMVYRSVYDCRNNHIPMER